MSETKERPIIFTADEAKAVLAGDKTQHRVPALTAEQINAGYEWDFGADGDHAVFYKFTEDGVSIEETLLIECPFGAIGDRLWVQEELKHRQPSNVDCCMQWAYASDNEWALNSGIPVNAHKQKLSAKSMPRWASRLLLEITDIRIERVQDITIGDALKEGFGMNFAFKYWAPKHGETAWLTNPWVWVIEFKQASEETE